MDYSPCRVIEQIPGTANVGIGKDLAGYYVTVHGRKWPCHRDPTIFSVASLREAREEAFRVALSATVNFPQAQSEVMDWGKKVATGMSLLA